MDIQEVLDRAQRSIADTDEVLWTEEALLIYLASAVQELLRWRPDYRLAAGDTVKVFPTTYEATDTLDLPDDCILPLAVYVAFLALSEDDADAGNKEKAALREAEFFRLIGVKK